MLSICVAPISLDKDPPSTERFRLIGRSCSVRCIRGQKVLSVSRYLEYKNFDVDTRMNSYNIKIVQK